MDQTGAPLRPTQLGRYEVLGELNRGGQGVVYLCRQPGTRRMVALKRFLPAGSRRSLARDLAEREVQAAARLHHPGIVMIFGVEELDGEPILVMEFVDGQPITHWAARRTLDAHASLTLL